MASRRHRHGGCHASKGKAQFFGKRCQRRGKIRTHNQGRHHHRIFARALRCGGNHLGKAVLIRAQTSASKAMTYQRATPVMGTKRTQTI